jgi:type IV pilus assembly protein PilE
MLATLLTGLMHGRFLATCELSARKHRSTGDARGFTLIEVLIVLVIVAILTAIALPAYREQLRRSARAEAQTFLTDMASRQQQFLADRRAYANAVPALNMSPPASLSGKFDFAVAAAAGPPPSFTLTAAATGDQASDLCPLLTIDSAGNRSPAKCW